MAKATIILIGFEGVGLSVSRCADGEKRYERSE
jgi:hypothetical protein